jgi:hypothetical protein
MGDVAGDLPDRVFRLKTLIALDADFGGSGIMLPGGEASYRAYIEARSSFVAGNFVATILLAQGLIENLLGGHLVLDDVSREVRRRSPRVTKPFGVRPTLKQLINHALEAGVLVERDVEDIERLIGMRNPLTHFRDINDPQNLTRRAMENDKHPERIMFEDARFAIATIIGIVGKAQFAIGRFAGD